MKKYKTGLLAIVVLISFSLSAFTSTSPKIVAGWYGQTTDAVPPYSTANFISPSALNTKCPVNTQHLCAVYLKSDGTLDQNQNPNQRMSSHNYQP